MEHTKDRMISAIYYTNQESLRLLFYVNVYAKVSQAQAPAQLIIAILSDYL
jgi:hypothetical protein